ncbi:MAG: hypothetical protein [Bacteriophage sp.]|nr:MAG: hypothetical protein [Bacteriophage sp.]UVM91554.1 MAG: hypothetical protein [Bacteriophage sp.]UVN01806.1 MAG: hypothetical protein [Bacteriophage sp.]UVX34527.1 MAG: hypothetical protein [Bacteriophage sp.]UVX36041.1 MAG: hypothetical protein [Bacteriophage sp.]
MKTDKQLLSLNKTELLAEYRKLEEEKATKDITLEEAIKVVEAHDLRVKSKTSYKVKGV